MKQFRGVCYMIEKQSYAKNELTKALLSLLKRKRLEDISISELCEEAGVSRLSFYRNYSSKEDILNRHITAVTSSFLHDTRVNFRTTPKKDFIIYLITHISRHKNIISTLIGNGLSYLLKNAFDEAFLRSVDIYHDPYRCYIAAGAYFNLVYYWFINGCKETPEELSELDITI